MFKKIKDLTVEELNCVCDKYEYCWDCPLSIHNNCIFDYVLNKEEYEEKIEKEIEVTK